MNGLQRGAPLHYRHVRWDEIFISGNALEDEKKKQERIITRECLFRGFHREEHNDKKNDMMGF